MADLNDGRVDLPRSRWPVRRLRPGRRHPVHRPGGGSSSCRSSKGDEYAPAGRGGPDGRGPAAGAARPDLRPRGPAAGRQHAVVDGQGAAGRPSRRARPRRARARGAAHRPADAARAAQPARCVRRARPIDLVPIERGVGREAALILAEERERAARDRGRGRADAQLPRRDRARPTGRCSSHVVGYTGPIDREELEALTDDGYLRDDVIGKSGIEASFEEELRGEYGASSVERDASGPAGQGDRDGAASRCPART